MKRYKLIAYQVPGIMPNGRSGFVWEEARVEEASNGGWVEHTAAQAEIKRVSGIYEDRIRELKQGDWVELCIKEAGWEDKEIQNVIGDGSAHVITFMDGAILLRGNIRGSTPTQKFNKEDVKRMPGTPTIGISEDGRFIIEETAEPMRADAINIKNPILDEHIIKVIQNAIANKRMPRRL